MKNPNTTWDGQGIPPVGTICELTDRVLLSGMEEAKWFDAGSEVEVAGHAIFNGASGVVCVIGASLDDIYTFTGTITETYLRPIRTPEQIAVELREKEIGELREIIKQAHYALPNTDIAPVEKAKAYASAIHKAGFRKGGNELAEQRLRRLVEIEDKLFTFTLDEIEDPRRCALADERKEILSHYREPQA